MSKIKKIDFELKHLTNLTDEQKALMTASKLRKYKRDQFLKEIIQNNKQDEINSELRRCIRNLELQLKNVTEKYDYLQNEILIDFEKKREQEASAKVFGLVIPLITYNECNDVMYDSRTNRKSEKNSELYNEYKRVLWSYFDKHEDEIRSLMPKLKDDNKYVKIVMSFHVNNMNKDTDNVEKPFLDTLFNWLNKNGKYYSDNQIITKDSVLTSSTRHRISGTVLDDEQLYFQIINTTEQLENLNDMPYRYLRYINQNKDKKNEQ